MPKIREGERYERVVRKGQSDNAIMLGFEWEIPIADDWYTAEDKLFDMGYLPFDDCECLEVMTPIDNLGQQKRWAKTLINAMDKFAQREWDHEGGIHVHFSMPTPIGSREESIKGKFRTFLETCFTRDELMNLSHRGVEYGECGRSYYAIGTRRRKPDGSHQEFRMFNSHRDLLIPALEFTHAMAWYVARTCGYDTAKFSREGFRKLIAKNPKYQNIASLIHKVENNEGYRGRPLWNENSDVH